MSQTQIIDLRSDTVTKPSAEMREVMMKALVGDDVYGEDPTVNLLQEKVAKLLQKDCALFVPSGTMANQIALGLHCQPGNEVLCDSLAHVNLWEGGGAARLWGTTLKTLSSSFSSAGILSLKDLQEAISPEDIHRPQTCLVWLENTLNRAGGQIFPLKTIEEISSWAKKQHMRMHLDGARLFNASVATKIPLHEWAKPFETVTVCLSKGLGAPVGSLIVGDRVVMEKALRLRKVLGGGMRQAGILAAAGIFALENNFFRLERDHHHAQVLADAIQEKDGLELEYNSSVETNIIWIKVDPSVLSAKKIVEYFKSQGVLISALGENLIRMCTHLDISSDDVEKVITLIRKL